MGQLDVIRVLLDNERASAREIRERTGLSEQPVLRSLKRLIETGEVGFVQGSTDRGSPMRIYYLIDPDSYRGLGAMP